jgi:TonB family protein
MVRPLLMLVVSVAVVVSSVSAESLGEAAQREKRRRAELGPQSYVAARDLAALEGSCLMGADRSAPCRLNDLSAHYPADVMRDSIEGVVVLSILVDAQGAVSEAAVVKAPLRPDGKAIERRLVDAALVAIKGTRYAPAEKDGVPVSAWIIVKVPFRLPKTETG